MNALFGGVQLSDRIGTLIPPTESVFINDSVLTNTLNDKSCTLPEHSAVHPAGDGNEGDELQRAPKAGENVDEP